MKQKLTHYYVQAQDGDKKPQIVCHTEDEETGELYHKFMDKKKAKKLLETEKKITPDVKFRVVKMTESYELGEWI